LGIFLTGADLDDEHGLGVTSQAILQVMCKFAFSVRYVLRLMQKGEEDLSQGGKGLVDVDHLTIPGLELELMMVGVARGSGR